MRYLSMLIWLAVGAGTAFLATVGLLSLGGWAECDRGDCGAFGEIVYWVFRALAWPALVLVSLAGAGILTALVKRLTSSGS